MITEHGKTRLNLFVVLCQIVNSLIEVGGKQGHAPSRKSCSNKSSRLLWQEGESGTAHQREQPGLNLDDTVTYSI